MYPYVNPQVYAWVFKKYYDYIKGPTVSGGLNCSSCVVHNGGIILANMDLSIRPDWSFGPLFGAVLTFLDIPVYVGASFLILKQDNYMAWTSKFLQVLIGGLGGRYDIFDIHTYDINYFQLGLGTQQSGYSNINSFIKLLLGGTYNYGLARVANNAFYCGPINGGAYNYGLFLANGREVQSPSGFPLYYGDAASCNREAAAYNAGNTTTPLFRGRSPIRWCGWTNSGISEIKAIIPPPS